MPIRDWRHSTTPNPDFASLYQPAVGATALNMEEKTVVTPYGSGEGKKVEVERMFDKIAPKYDLLNRVLSLGIDVRWRKRMIG